MKSAHTTVIGQTKAGLWSPGSAVLGNHADNGFPAPDIINMTLASLDPRLTYTGPAHYYFNSAGALVLSDANEWPVEYRDGAPAGRHEPEPAATNNQTQMRANIGVRGVSDPIACLGFDPQAGIGPDGGGIGLYPGTLTKYAVYDMNIATWLVPDRLASEPIPSDSWQRIAVNFSLAAAARIRTYFGRLDGSNAIYGLCQELTPGEWTTSFMRQASGASILGGFVQVEAGEIATSPIITTDAVVSRDASSVVMDTTGVSYIVVGYSDGSSNNYDTPDDTFTIPLMSRNWGERYISAIEVISE